VAQIRYVSIVPPGKAGGVVADVYAQMERDFGMLAPPVVLHSPAEGPLAASWVMLRESLLAQGACDRAAKETVAAAVSLGNDCPYCVAVHGAVLGGLDHKPEAAVITGGQLGAITDPALRDLAVWARSTVRRSAGPPPARPYSAEQMAELAAVAVTFHYLNRMVTVFCEQSPLPGAVPAGLAGGLMGILGRFLGNAARTAPQPGASLDLLPGPLPAGEQAVAEPRWATASGSIAKAFTRAGAVIEAAAGRTVPAPVCELVRAELAAWDGQPRGLSRSWADDAVSGLPVADRIPGRLALLTAFAPHQVSQTDIGEFRRGQFTDRELIELTSWASLAAAGQAGDWLAG
jgi:AhpD family alkylhydroperoxidase